MAEVGYRNLKVWQKSMTAVEEVYRSMREFPKDEMYALANQLRRAAVSIPSNIAEGYDKGGKDYPRHLKIARGSCGEVETQIEIAVRLEYISRERGRELWKLYNEVGKMLTGLIRSLSK